MWDEEFLVFILVLSFFVYFLIHCFIDNQQAEKQHSLFFNSLQK